MAQANRQPKPSKKGAGKYPTQAQANIPTASIAQLLPKKWEVRQVAIKILRKKAQANIHPSRRQVGAQILPNMPQANIHPSAGKYLPKSQGDMGPNLTKKGAGKYPSRAQANIPTTSKTQFLPRKGQANVGPESTKKGAGKYPSKRRQISEHFGPPKFYQKRRRRISTHRAGKYPPK